MFLKKAILNNIPDFAKSFWALASVLNVPNDANSCVKPTRSHSSSRVTMLIAPPSPSPPYSAGTIPLYTSMYLITSIGISLISKEPSGLLSGKPLIYTATRLPSKPCTDMRDALPNPPVFLTLMPDVRVRISSIPLERPRSLDPSTTVTAIGLCRMRFISACWEAPLTTTSSSTCEFSFSVKFKADSPFTFTVCIIVL